MRIGLKRFFSVAIVSALLAGLPTILSAATYDLVIDEQTAAFTGRERPAMAINGQIPGPTLRWTEGEEITINVTNRLDVPTSLHWHGIILPFTMDGVPGLSFDGIAPGETFTYRFTLNQAGTYWYHSHSALQEQSGVYGPIVIEPSQGDPREYDRDYVVMLSDWTDEDPHTVLANLKKQSDYYNYNKRTVVDFFRDVSEEGWSATIQNRLDWGEMRMDPTDIADVTGYTFLVNGRTPTQNWTALFQPGERVRLRFVNGSAMTFFDVRIPGLKMTLIQADGQDVEPVQIDEFQIAVAETYDVIVEPAPDQAYTIFAESMDRTGYARGTLAPRDGMTAAIPKMRPRQILTMADMGAAHGGGHGGHDMHDITPDSGTSPTTDHGPMGHMSMDHSTMDHAAMGHGPGTPQAADASTASTPRVLVYGDLKAAKAYYDSRAPTREILLRLTGNMERYFWSFNDLKYSEADPIRFDHNERLRIKFVNETMMNHPIHLHGMWMELDVGKGVFNPRKHVINVKPGEIVYVNLTADALGRWAFHCHLLYHMDTGMFREVRVEKADDKIAQN